jgi:hypothetical protein
MSGRDATLRPVIAVIALVLAPLGSALILLAIFMAGDLIDGMDPRFSLRALVLATPIALLLFVVGGALIAVFWKRAPFGLVPCLAIGATCGTFAFYIVGLGLSDVDDYAAFEREGRLFDYYWGFVQLLGMGLLAGAGGGVTFWQICRFGSRKSA